MFGRYKRLVPKAQRDLIRRHRLPKPNWFVGSAEATYPVDVEAIARDPEVRAEIERLKREINARADRERDGS